MTLAHDDDDGVPNSVCLDGESLGEARHSAVIDQLEPGEKDIRAKSCAVTTDLDVTLARDDDRRDEAHKPMGMTTMWTLSILVSPCVDLAC